MGKCAKCGKEVDPAWALCPFCGESLKKSCPKCGKEVDPAWALCPFCGEQLKGGAKPEPKAEKFKFEFSEDTAELSESFDRQLKEQAKPKVPAGIIDKDKALDMYWCGDENDIKNSMKSIIYYAEQGDAECQYVMSILFDPDGYDGLGIDLSAYGIKPDVTESFIWGRKAAEQGQNEAQCMLGEIYASNDKGVKKDLVKSFSWTLKSAQNNNGNAMFNAGIDYLLGKGVAVNSSEGLSWLKKAKKIDYAYDLHMDIFKGKEPENYKKIESILKNNGLI